MTYFCPMCTVVHEEWGEVSDLDAYYTSVNHRPAPPIAQCLRCLFRMPHAYLWKGSHEQEETSINVQEYAQMEMF